ncbi:unnamed protein product [Pleuronectes platessa]|uniref:Uncharacterized protein n=1 Tax=Pleuronectes platessa TaxID=8262 RepID=A0A9N7V5P1_PLEPL|nr:unnamed protein product [Pleuronectes platessa]
MPTRKALRGAPERPVEAFPNNIPEWRQGSTDSITLIQIKRFPILTHEFGPTSCVHWCPGSTHGSVVAWVWLIPVAQGAHFSALPPTSTGDYVLVCVATALPGSSPHEADRFLRRFYLRCVPGLEDDGLQGTEHEYQRSLCSFALCSTFWEMANKFLLSVNLTTTQPYHLAPTP